ncbi:erythrocyte membrane protein 1, PfEMP1, putative [Plasmodium sp.]|nr:erythrocyte membrane protein 1, PfEMP1, putative [Plasmodium sp.]
MAPGVGSSNRRAKDVLDEIGGIIQKKVQGDADTYRSELKGNFGEARFYNGNEILQPLSEFCHLDYTLDTNVTDGHSNPCEGRQTVRFSDERRSQCMKHRIRGSENDDVGACAPYRRVHVCDRNLEEINPKKITTTHNLLVDILLAAQHEGESIIDNYPSDHHNKEGICTALARSFADIGDIIRGKDLYRGNKQEKDKLQKQLKEYFKELHKNLSNLKARQYYKDDTDGNFYQLREDWWNANRYDVWKAITCKATDTQYFRNTCSNGTTSTDTKCHCIDGTVPTNLDYVPQYLRWFEEWTEEFCRIKELKLENLEKECRGVNESGKKRYCSRNGHNCEETIRAIGKLRLGNGCTRCLFACNPYVEWIINKEEQFNKQKKKCQNEIYQNKRSKGPQNDKINKLYYDVFYTQFKTAYPTVNEFLKSLNKETTCTNLEEDTEKKLDFNDNTKTFSYSKYCQLCPWCAVQEDKDGNFVPRRNKQGNCEGENLYTPKSSVDPTVINVLISGEKEKEIKQKLEAFCDESNSSRNSSLYEEWKCYYEDVYNEACILKKKNKSVDEPEEIQKSFYDFFKFWVAHMLKDSVEWRTKKIERCLKNKEQICIKKCNRNCKCYQKWIEKKEQEWKKIKEHFDKQESFKELGHYYVLEKVLEEEFSTDLTNVYGEQKEVQRIAELLRNKTDEGPDDATKRNTIIDELLDHELEEAQECTENNPNDECDASPDHDEDDFDEEETHYNPCGKTGGITVRAKEIAKKFQREAISLMKNNTRNGGTSRKGAHSSLVGDISKAYFKNGGKGNDLIGEKICNISTRHSNDGRTGNNGGPCTGKNVKRFDIGTTWETGTKVEMTETEAFMPPRRQHICTSNLEKLHVDSVINNLNGGTPSDSLLGDVLLAAKFEADDIVRKLPSDSDKSALCRTMKYSFADIGDIIRGKDMWDQNRDATGLQGNLKNIFSHIHTSLKKTLNGNDKYTGDVPDYKQLRSDWWSANRHQVWKAMQCAKKEGKKVQCGTTPYDDYIPQHLRWMTEWSEWYCKAQKDAYDKLKEKCGKCKNKNGGKGCMQNDSDCDTCNKQCKEYTEFIKKWQPQWTKMDGIYQMIYLYALNDASNNLPIGYGGVNKYKDVFDFLKELHKQNKTTGSPRSKRSTRGSPTPTANTPITPYSTAAGYIHQEAHISHCNTQNIFCKDPTNKGDKNKYAFEEPPTEYKDSCNCKNHRPKAACEIVEDLFKPGNETKFTEACKHKYSKGKEKYTQWRCINDSVTSTTGNSVPTRSPPAPVTSASSLTSPEATASANSANSVTSATCIPPRRQQMYIPSLSGTESPVELRTKFIEMAAIETFFQWHKYIKEKEREIKEKKERENRGATYIFFAEDEEQTLNELDPREELKSGTIPDDFVRQMFYTFGDYRDLCIGKYIGKDKDTVKKNINKIFQNTAKGSGKKNTAENWWDENGEDIWKGMLCALSYDTDTKDMIPGVRNNLMEDTKNPAYNYNNVTINGGPSSGTTLSNFAKRPTFFRWLEEWGEEFCRKKKIKIDKIIYECRGERGGHQYCSGDGYDCEDDRRRYNDMFAHLDCRDCERECRNYNKWIRNKKNEFDNQNNKYVNEIKKLISSLKNESDREFYNNLNEKGYNSINSFLESLNQGKLSQNNKDKNYKIDFKNPENTFNPSTYCKVCPFYGVTRARNGEYKPINSKVENTKEGEPTVFDILLDNGATDVTDKKLQEKCTEYGLYKDLREQQWKCQKQKDEIYQCNIINTVDHEHYDDKIPFNILFHRWINDFMQYYNKSKERITRCTKKGENKCVQGCNNKCDCVKEWLNRKSKEWDTIKKYYKDNLETEQESTAYTVKTFFQQIPFDSYAEEAKKVVEGEEEQENLWGCTGRNIDGDKKKCDNDEFITNLISKLQDKITSCQTQHDPSGKPDQTCVDTPLLVEEETSTLDDDKTDKQSPTFCPQEEVVPEKPKVPETESDSTKPSKIPKKSETSIEDILNKCPYNNDTCNNYRNKKNIGCRRKEHHADLNYWTNALIKYDKGKSTDMNHAIFVPPRRRQLCSTNIRRFYSKIYSEEKFREYFLPDAYNEAIQLSRYYGKDNEKILEAIKNSFADYGNIIKGDDMLGDGLYEIMQKILDKLNEKKTDGEKETLQKLWEKNKKYVWYVMLCGYKDAGGKIENNYCNFHNEQETDQFLRWLLEWGKVVCKEKKKRKEALEMQCECSGSTGKSGYEIINSDICKNELEEYITWNKIIKKSLDLLNIKYENVIKPHNGSEKSSELTVEQYIETGIKIGECNLFDIHEIHDIYTNKEINSHKEILKRLCPDLDFTYDTTENTETSEDTYTEEDTEKNKPATPAVKPSPKPEVPPHPRPPVNPPPPADEPFDPTILQTTIPFGIALALGSIAFFFMKKKTQAPVDLFSVINIPKGDYDIPTLKSSNRYIPYASDRHKGKTYIYMEGDSSADEKYAFMSDTTDVTSSESEYEELDINDIYVPGSPKYKTLIEVVLEPSKRDIQSDNTPMNKFTDDEWNQLKHDFISNMLQNQPNDVPNDYKSGDIPLNTQPNTLYFNKPEEKPFITSIHDRNLYSGEEHSYNVNMVNNDNIPLSGKNDVYSGIDLINDSLNNNNVDIYDEVLKRKENELFGTNHPKHTNTHNVTKSSNSDPIDNQLDLFHTWLDRHRDMCEQWNNKEEVLDKLKEEWNKDNNGGNIPNDSNKTLNTDVSIQIHMDNPKPTNEFTNMDTILEDLEKYNDPYYDVQDDFYYDVNDHDTSTVDSNNMDVPSKVQIEMDVNTKLVKEKYPIADVWDI